MLSYIKLLEQIISNFLFVDIQKVNGLNVILFEYLQIQTAVSDVLQLGLKTESY